MTGYVSLDNADLAIASLLILANALLSLALGLDLHRKFLLASLRMVVQLSLMGLVLASLFALRSPWWTSLAALTMVGFAGYEASSRQDRKLRGWWTQGIGTGAVLMAASIVTIFALTTTLRPDPWYDPRYAIPLLGMVLGNTITGISLGLNGLLQGVVQRRVAVEAQLMLGASRREALAPVVRQAMRQALMPILNTMSATGVVALPGMMTGQILGGVAPVEAVKYQILILFLIAGGTGLGAVSAVMLGGWRLFDGRQRLRLDRLRT